MLLTAHAAWVLIAAVIVVAGFLLADASWAVWVALLISLVFIAVSIFYYSPVMLPARNPGWIDHLEDELYTGLLFVAAALLNYHLAGLSLS